MNNPGLEALADQHPTSNNAQEIIRELKDLGWVEGPHGQGTYEGMTLAEGGGLTWRDGKDNFLEWSPGDTPHHKGGPYWKISTGDSGTLRTAGATAVVISLIPGAETLAEGRPVDAAGEALLSANPWGWVGDMLGLIMDFANSDREVKPKDKWINKR